VPGPRWQGGAGRVWQSGACLASLGSEGLGVAGKVWHGVARRVEARLGWHGGARCGEAGIGWARCGRHDPERGWITIPSPFIYSFSQARRENPNGSVVGGPGGPGGSQSGLPREAGVQ
jgi:hypothetical protein